LLNKTSLRSVAEVSYLLISFNINVMKKKRNPH
jgi:hypothetical protein